VPLCSIIVVILLPWRIFIGNESCFICHYLWLLSLNFEQFWFEKNWYARNLTKISEVDNTSSSNSYFTARFQLSLPRSQRTQSISCWAKKGNGFEIANAYPSRTKSERLVVKVQQQAMAMPPAIKLPTHYLRALDTDYQEGLDLRALTPPITRAHDSCVLPNRTIMTSRFSDADAAFIENGQVHNDVLLFLQ